MIAGTGEEQSTMAAEERAARARGGNGQGTRARLAGLAARGELRSVAHLKVVHSLSARFNRLNDLRQIGEAITALSTTARE